MRVFLWVRTETANIATDLSEVIGTAITLNHDLMSSGNKLAHTGRGHTNTVFMIFYLFWDADKHVNLQWLKCQNKNGQIIYVSD